MDKTQPELPREESHKDETASVEGGSDGTKMEAFPRTDLVQRYNLFRDHFKPKADVVYHPCGGNDVSPSTTFPNSKVIYAEIDPKSIKALENGGFEIHGESALEFDPGEVDILILLNPSIDVSVPVSHVKSGGFVVCNDYHGTATSLKKNSDFEFKAIIRKSKEGGFFVDDSDLENCWQEVETDEEFKNADSNLFSCVNYQIASRVVQNVTGKTENILAEYKKLIALAREQQKRINEDLLTDIGDDEGLRKEFLEITGYVDQMEALKLNHDGQEFVLNTRLPKKKGNADDIFVFQKKG